MAKGLVNAVAAGNGVWFEIQNTRKMSIHVFGITDATVVISGSNEPTIPANSSHGITLATTTADAMIVIDMPVIWMKHRISGYTSGTISTHIAGGYDG